MVERFFAEITRKRIRRGIFKSVDELKHTIMDYLDNHNGQPKPYIWTKTAAEIFSKSPVRNNRQNHNTNVRLSWRYFSIRDSSLSSCGSQGPLNEFPDLLDCVMRFGQKRHEQMPDVKHARPHLQLDRTLRDSELLRHARSIIEQDFVASHLNQDRR
jgi:hypothetical protein